MANAVGIDDVRCKQHFGKISFESTALWCTRKSEKRVECGLRCAPQHEDLALARNKEQTTN